MKKYSLKDLLDESTDTNLTLTKSALILQNNTSTLKNLISEIHELRDYNESLNNQLYKSQSEISQKDIKLSILENEKQEIKNENKNLKSEINYLKIKSIVFDIVDRSFMVSIDRELSSSIKMRSNGTSIFSDSFPKGSKLNIEIFKKNLMNSTKKKLKISPTSCTKHETSDFIEAFSKHKIEDQTNLIANDEIFPDNLFVFDKKQTNMSNGHLISDTFSSNQKNQFKFDKILIPEKDQKPIKKDSFSSNHLFVQKKEQKLELHQNLIKKHDKNQELITPQQRSFIKVHQPENQSKNHPENNISTFSSKKDTRLNQVETINVASSANIDPPIKVPKKNNDNGLKSTLKNYSESDKIAKEHLSSAVLFAQKQNELSSSNKELTLKDMIFMTDPKVLEIKINFLLRIKEEVTIESFDKFNKIKQHFGVIFVNKFNNQNSILNHAKKEIDKNEHTFFIALGAKKSGKTFTIQGYKDFPGLLPGLANLFDFSEAGFLQIFDVKKEMVDDLIKLNGLLFNDPPVVNKFSRLHSVKVRSISDMNKILKIVISKRMKKENLDEWNFVIRLIFSNERSVNFVETCCTSEENLQNLSFIKTIINKGSKTIATSKNTLIKLLFPAHEIESKYGFNLISHLTCIESEGETKRLLALME